MAVGFQDGCQSKFVPQAMMGAWAVSTHLCIYLQVQTWPLSVCGRMYGQQCMASGAISKYEQQCGSVVRVRTSLQCISSGGGPGCQCAHLWLEKSVVTVPVEAMTEVEADSMQVCGCSGQPYVHPGE